MVELEMIESISHETVRQTLKKELKPRLKSCWCIPVKESAEFVCAMEDVLSVYLRPISAHKPLMCMDETHKQHVKESRLPPPGRPGGLEKHDYDYE